MCGAAVAADLDRAGQSSVFTLPASARVRPAAEARATIRLTPQSMRCGEQMVGSPSAQTVAVCEGAIELAQVRSAFQIGEFVHDDVRVRGDDEPPEWAFRRVRQRPPVRRRVPARIRLSKACAVNPVTEWPARTRRGTSRMSDRLRSRPQRKYALGHLALANLLDE